ncbi:ATP-dependent endonuclease [Nocardioides sp. YIM 152315]|uniref:ATP-dependent endonuclease n=1 Tax=Nocardioides sp. YIM 152315 TaxID=3031760 RepID=UPI0023DAE63E|nr:ATP-dependent endonuclease [Nocardioides sp. YIM 152315]MDF1605870.1 ATP-dependent endonuclease [Nocardioides sp. YIM 152315]
MRDKLEPLTANRVLAVEGISDRIIVQQAADLTDRNLDRLGVSLIATDGAGDMGAIIKLFGPHGFNIPLNLLIDEDARTATATKLGVPPGGIVGRVRWALRMSRLDGAYTWTRRWTSVARRATGAMRNISMGVLPILGGVVT